MPMLSKLVALTGVATATASYSMIAGYSPGSQVTDHNAIDLDQLLFEELLDQSVTDYANAIVVYENGGNSRSQVTFTLNAALTEAIPSGISVAGIGENGLATTGATRPAAIGDTTLLVRYTIGDAQTSYVACRNKNYATLIAAIPGTTPGTPRSSAQETGCFTTTGTLTLTLTDERTTPTWPAASPGVVQTNYITYTAVAHSNGRTLQGFTSNGARSGPTSGCPGCPYKDFMMYYDYYGDLAYGDTWVMAALQNTATNYPSGRGNADWTTTTGHTGRVEGATKGTNYIITYMYAIREFEDAIDDCVAGNLGLNDEPVHAWDEGVAFYTGSLEGEAGTRGRAASPTGVMSYNLADYRCQNFNTCGLGGGATSGTSDVNHRLLQLFIAGQGLLLGGNCDAVRPVTDDIVDLMRIPLIQGTLRYAYRVHLLPSSCSDMLKCQAEMATFAAGILPPVHYCSPTAAATIHTSTAMAASTSTNFTAVKLAFESVYTCLNITCEDVGGFWNSAVGDYHTGATPCGWTAATGFISPPPPPVGMTTTAPQSSDDDDDISGGAMAAIIAAAVVAVLAVIFLCVLVSRERAGTPIFTKLAPPGVTPGKGNAVA